MLFLRLFYANLTDTLNTNITVRTVKMFKKVSWFVRPKNIAVRPEIEFGVGAFFLKLIFCRFTLDLLSVSQVSWPAI